jgi:hypothetical protein
MNLSVMGQRKGDLSNAAPERYRGLRGAAERISLRNVDGATCELMNEALSRLVQLCYEQDAGGYCNQDGATGRILIPLPWGRNGQARWGIKPQEANILREILFTWQADPPSLLNYDRARKSWFINLPEYSNYHLAKRWLSKYQVTIATYRLARAKRLAGS